MLMKSTATRIIREASSLTVILKLLQSKHELLVVKRERLNVNAYPIRYIPQMLNPTIEVHLVSKYS